jgi:hypothetical protein
MHHLILSLCLLSASASPAIAGVQVIAYIGTPCRGVQHAHVELPQLGWHELADEHGRAVLNHLPVGTHQLVVWTIGWPPVSTEIVVMRAGEDLILVADLESGSIARVRPTQASDPNDKRYRSNGQQQGEGP